MLDCCHSFPDCGKGVRAFFFLINWKIWKAGSAIYVTPYSISDFAGILQQNNTMSQKRAVHKTVTALKYGQILEIFEGHFYKGWNN